MIAHGVWWHLGPIGAPTVPGTHCPCGNQRRAGRRCCRGCERYFWARDAALRPRVQQVARCLNYCRYRLPREACDEITAFTVALAVRAERAAR